MKKRASDIEFHIFKIKNIKSHKGKIITVNRVNLIHTRRKRIMYKLFFQDSPKNKNQGNGIFSSQNKKPKLKLNGN